ncbi:protein of unknown function DUF92 transmembrane [Paenibacillus curdlanolyticus YK9]|uniref:DUF92 domain-containing protein n=1 Tax=Paenibacillus curdlanolyticus YK9 TaxID=717606 RepID=E0I4V9_9BACL|nr:DUF92 domain-containing protein [Paenibacillus curdlanolyticus]EFM12640.1 protein of unknown function DUF92 transmembrane [Paenibacillus curdlanolyticus YK9]
MNLLDWQSWVHDTSWIWGGHEGLIPRAVVGVAGGAYVGRMAIRKRALTRSGAAAAAVMGACYTTFGGVLWFATLLMFFVTSSMLSRWKKHHRSKQAAEQNYEKKGARDAGQVWANGGVGLLLCIVHAAWPSPYWLAAFVGVMAAVNADTWATEVGALSRQRPRSILTGKRVATGTSGGVTMLGSGAAAAGAFVIGLTAACLAAVPGYQQAGGYAVSFGLLAGIGTLAGVAGAFIDSYLGATIQAMFRCSVCGSETERMSHCGQATAPVRGWAWMNNDRVNMLASVAAGAVAWGLSLLIHIN